MNTFFIIKQLFIHSQIDEKVLSGDSLFFYVSVILFLKKERFTSDVSCNCIWFYCFYEDSGDQAVSAGGILVMEGNPGDWYMWQTGKYYGRWFTQENLLNILLLFPAGILLPGVTGRKLKWWMGLLVGIAVSSAIEISQLLLCRGLFEFDDIIHNSLGCMLGSLLGNRMLRLVHGK